jgi:hypothetical protein
MAFQDSLFDPSFLLAAIAYLEIATDIWGKAAAGFETTLTDPWGRLLSYMLLSGSDDGVSTTLSSVTELSPFQSSPHWAPKHGRENILLDGVQSRTSSLLLSLVVGTAMLVHSHLHII